MDAYAVGESDINKRENNNMKNTQIKSENFQHVNNNNNNKDSPHNLEKKDNGKPLITQPAESTVVLHPIKITALYITELAYLIDPKTKKPAKYDCPHCSKPICPKKGKQHITLDRSCKSCVEYDYCSHCTIRANQWRGKITMLYQYASTVPIDFIFVDATAGCDHRIRCEKCGHYKFCFSSHSCKKKDFVPLSSFEFSPSFHSPNTSPSSHSSSSSPTVLSPGAHHTPSLPSDHQPSSGFNSPSSSSSSSSHLHNAGVSPSPHPPNPPRSVAFPPSTLAHSNPLDNPIVNNIINNNNNNNNNNQSAAAAAALKLSNTSNIIMNSNINLFSPLETFSPNSLESALSFDPPFPFDSPSSYISSFTADSDNPFNYNNYNNIYNNNNNNNNLNNTPYNYNNNNINNINNNNSSSNSSENIINNLNSMLNLNDDPEIIADISEAIDIDLINNDLMNTQNFIPLDYSTMNNLNNNNININNNINNNRYNNNNDNEEGKDPIDLLWKNSFGELSNVDKTTFSLFISRLNIDAFEWDILKTTSIVGEDDVFKESAFKEWFKRLGPTNSDYYHPYQPWCYFLYRVSQVAEAIIECANIQSHSLSIVTSRSHPESIVLSWNPRNNNETKKKFRIRCSESGFRLYKDPLMRNYAYQDQSLISVLHKFIAEH